MTGNPGEAGPHRPGARIAQAAVVVVGGFVLLNLAFLAYALFVGALELLLGVGGEGSSAWSRASVMLAFLVLLGLATGAVGRSNLPAVAKATWSTVLPAGAYAAIGATLWRTPLLVLIVGFGFFSVAAWFLRSRRLGWLYWWALAAVSVAMLAITVTGTDI